MSNVMNSVYIKNVGDTYTDVSDVSIFTDFHQRCQASLPPETICESFGKVIKENKMVTGFTAVDIGLIVACLAGTITVPWVAVGVAVGALGVGAIIGSALLVLNWVERSAIMKGLYTGKLIMYTYTGPLPRQSLSVAYLQDLAFSTRNHYQAVIPPVVSTYSTQRTQHIGQHHNQGHEPAS